MYVHRPLEPAFAPTQIISRHRPSVVIFTLDSHLRSLRTHFTRTLNHHRLCSKVICQTPVHPTFRTLGKILGYSKIGIRRRLVEHQPTSMLLQSRRVRTPPRLRWASQIL